MAIQSAFYFTDGTTRTFPSTKHIAFSTNAAVWMKRVVDDVWELTSHELWTLSQNSIVFTVAPQSTVYSQIELRVADDADELTESPSNIALVAGSIANVDTVATNISAVNTVSTNITAVQNTSANATNINTVATNIANVNTVGPDITKVNTVATNITNVNAVCSNIANVNTTATNIADINNVVIQVIPNLSEILLADDNATTATNKALEASNSATTATNKALEASNSATTATNKALEASNSATTATNKALEASGSATIATNKALEASNSATTATTKAEEASYYATITNYAIVETLAELEVLDTTQHNNICVVKDIDRGGTFIWSSTGTANGGTVFAGATGYWNRQYSGAVNVKWFGAKGDGVTDDTVAIQKAFELGKNIYFGSNSYKVSDTINITSYMTIDAYGAVIRWVGVDTKPLYNIIAPAEAIIIAGGLYLGRPSAWLYSVGVTANPTSITDYARFKVRDVHVVGAITFIDAQKAARFKVSNVDTYTDNAFNLYGKIVETKISDSVIFGSSGAEGTFGIKSRIYSGAEVTKYPEGIHMSNCTIDHFGRTFEIYDIFAMTVSNCYIGKILNNNLPIFIQRGESTHCREIIFTGNVIDGGIEIGGGTGTVVYNTTIKGNTFINANSHSIRLFRAYGINIEGNKFESAILGGDRFAILVYDHCGDLTVNNNSIDNTYLRIFQSSGSNGADIRVYDNYSGSANCYFSRPTMNRNNGVEDDKIFTYLFGVVTSGDYFTQSISATFAKGEKFLLVLSLSILTTTGGLLRVSLPSGLAPNAGTGWSDAFLPIDGNQNGGKRSYVLPLFATADIDGETIRIQNFDIPSVSISYHSTMSLIRI